MYYPKPDLEVGRNKSGSSHSERFIAKPAQTGGAIHFQMGDHHATLDRRDIRLLWELLSWCLGLDEQDRIDHEAYDIIHKGAMTREPGESQWSSHTTDEEVRAAYALAEERVAEARRAADRSHP